MRLYSREEIENYIYNQLIETCSNYKFMVDFVFPLMRQNALRKCYLGILIRLESVTSGAVILGLGKLLDNSNDGMVIHFKKYIQVFNGVEKIHIKDAEKWSQFLMESKRFLADLPGLKANLDPLRNRFLAHISPAKPETSEIKTWLQWREVLERMEKIFNLCQGALKESETPRFWTVNMDHEIEPFLRWCRLDDFETHRKSGQRPLKLNSLNGFPPPRE